MRAALFFMIRREDGGKKGAIAPWGDCALFSYYRESRCETADQCTEEKHTVSRRNLVIVFEIRYNNFNLGLQGISLAGVYAAFLSGASSLPQLCAGEVCRWKMNR